MVRIYYLDCKRLWFYYRGINCSVIGFNMCDVKIRFSNFNDGWLFRSMFMCRLFLYG